MSNSTKTADSNKKSFIRKLFPCFASNDVGSSASSSSGREYIVENGKVSGKRRRSNTYEEGGNDLFEVDRNKLQVGMPIRQESTTLGNMTWSEARRRETEVLSNISGATLMDLEKRFYEYIRMKTYSKMNPYRMSPNDFLNNISSVFVDNLNDPIPKDPFRLPKVYNNVPYERKFKEFSQSQKRAKKKTESKIQRKKRSISKTQTSAFSYKEAIEDDEPYSETVEKILVWRLVVVNHNDEEM